MPGDVNRVRSYHSPRRREQAAATRLEILQAARRLFEGQGYAGTTMTAIAAEAGVALKTVYVAFETKSGLLRALWDVALSGEQDSIPVAQREWYREMIEEPDPERQLRLNARNSRAVKVRAGSLLRVIREAAPVEPDSAALWGLIQSEFHDNQRVIVASLADRNALREGLDVDSAADLLWTLNHPDVWQLLVVDRGWSAERYEQWLADATSSQLLGGA